MHASSRGVVPALVALALIVGGTGIAQAQTVIIGERAMPAPIVGVVPAARVGYAWVPGHWAWRRGAWFWVKGHHVAGVVEPMPAPVVEVVTVRPSPGHVWVKGHHAWEGGKEVFVVWACKANPSPFITETATKVFKSTDEAIAFFKTKGYIK